MGTEGAWIPLVMAAVSAGTQYYNAEKTADRQDTELASRLTADAERQRRADAEVQKLIQQTAQSTPQEEIKSSLAQFTEQLRKAQGGQVSALEAPSGASDRYKKDAAAAASGVSQYGDKLSGLFSRIDAAQRQREGEAVQRADLGTVIDLIGRESQGANFLSDMRMNSIRDNPWLTALSQVTAGAASGYGGGAKSAPAGKQAGKVAPYKKPGGKG